MSAIAMLICLCVFWSSKKYFHEVFHLHLSVPNFRSTLEKKVTVSGNWSFIHTTNLNIFFVMPSTLPLGKWFVPTCMIIFLPFYFSWNRYNCSHMPLIFAPLFVRLTEFCGSHLEIFFGRIYFVIMSLKIANSNCFEVWFSCKGSDRQSFDCSWRSKTFPFFLTCYHFFIRIDTFYKLQKFLDGLLNFLFQFNMFIFFYFFLALSCFFFNSFDLATDNWAIITLSINQVL